MAKTVIQAMQYGIHFNHPNGESYAIGWWQIEKEGFTHWHNHLKEKRWFTDEISREFTDLCMEHLERV